MTMELGTEIGLAQHLGSGFSFKHSEQQQQKSRGEAGKHIGLIPTNPKHLNPSLETHLFLNLNSREKNYHIDFNST